MNAVVISTDDDPEADQKLRSLTRGRVAVLTNGSSREHLPLAGNIVTLGDLTSFTAATAAEQERIFDAVQAFAIRPDLKTGRVPKTPRKIVPPEFSATPTASDFRPREETPAGRALAAANYLSSVWSAWLHTEDERRRRALNSKGELWMMPADLADPEIAELPSEFAQALTIQPLI